MLSCPGVRKTFMNINRPLFPPHPIPFNRRLTSEGEFSLLPVGAGLKPAPTAGFGGWSERHSNYSTDFRHTTVVNCFTNPFEQPKRRI
jgi:hypothetical protein